MKKAIKKIILVIIGIVAIFSVAATFFNLSWNDISLQNKIIAGITYSVPDNEEQPEDIFPVNINTADFHRLKSIEGISGSVADNIIAYRNEHGFFHSPEELINVKGIGKKTLEKIRDKITL